MTFEAQARTSGREIVRIVELVVPRCVLRYGNNPCTAGARAAPHPNILPMTEVFSGGTDNWAGAQLVLSSYIAPNSTLTGVLVVDSHTGSAISRSITVNSKNVVFAQYAGSSAWLYASLHMLKKPAAGEPTTCLRVLGWNAANSYDYRMVVDGFTGCWSANDVNAVGRVFGAKIVDCGSWWRFGFGFNLLECRSLQVAIYPAGNLGGVSLGLSAPQVGSAGLWGAALHVGTATMPPYITRGVESQWLSSGLSQACYHTAQTCQALSAYLAGDQSIFFIDEKVDLPQGFEAFPALVNVSLTPSRLNPQMGIGESARLTVDLRDFSYNDAGTDPYVDARSYTPNSQGTFFGRFFARDPYIQGKKLRYYEGYYTGSGTFTFSHYLVREFILDDADRPDSKGRVRLRGTDLLRLTNEDRALCPIPSTATLQGNLTATAANTAIFLPSSAAAAYLTDAHVRIDEELLFLVTQTGCSWTTSRGAGNSTIAVHSAGSVVQVCQTYSYMNVCSVTMDLLVNKATIPASYIPVNSWDAEKASTLTTYNLYNIISKPTAVRDLLTQVMQTCDLSVWYDETVAKIALRHQSPWAMPSVALSDSGSFIADSMTIKSRDDLKVSRFGIRYAPTNYADGSDYSRYQLAVNSMREDARFDGRKSEHVVEKAWLSSSHDALAATIAGRGLLRYSELTPLEAQFRADATTVGSVRTGDVVEISTRLLQNVDGTMAATRMQVIEHGPEQAGHSYRYNALLYQGLSAATSLSIDVSTYNYNVHSAAGGPTAAVRVYLTVGSGVYVGGSGTNFAAITTSGLPSGSIVYLTIVGSATVLGYAGQRGEGAQGNVAKDPGTGDWVYTLTSTATDGGEGGTAFYIAEGVAAYIDVSGGYLFAGGPGGGGGGAYQPPGSSFHQDGAYGGVGQGFTNSGGPTAPDNSVIPHGGNGGVWGGTANSGDSGSPYSVADPGRPGHQGFAVELASASAVYYFTAGYDATRVKGLVGL